MPIPHCAGKVPIWWVARTVSRYCTSWKCWTVSATQGLLKTSGFEEARLTFHDPCQLVRRGGVLDQPRNLLKMVAKNYVETSDPGKMNWCCGGGGGVSAIEEAEGLRLTAFKVKKEQLEQSGAKTLVTACANCRIVLEEGLEHYKMEIPVVGLTETIAKHLVEGE